MGRKPKKKYATKKEGSQALSLKRQFILIAVTAVLTAFLSQGVPRIIDALQEPRPDTNVYTQEVPEGFVIFVQNRGDKTDRVKITVGTIGGHVLDYRIRDGAPIRLVEGGPVGNYAQFMIDELLPDSYQAITIVTEVEELSELTAWSEYTGDIKNVTKKPLTISVGPLETRPPS